MGRLRHCGFQGSCDVHLGERLVMGWQRDVEMDRCSIFCWHPHAMLFAEVRCGPNPAIDAIRDTLSE